MKKLLNAFMFTFFIYNSQAQQTEVKLYKGVAPGSENWTQKEAEYIQ